MCVCVSPHCFLLSVSLDRLPIFIKQNDRFASILTCAMATAIERLTKEKNDIQIKNMQNTHTHTHSHTRTRTQFNSISILYRNTLLILSRLLTSNLFTNPMRKNRTAIEYSNERTSSDNRKLISN